MISQKNLENARKLLKKHGQSHLLAFWGQLDDSQRQHLLADIETLDLDKIDVWVENYVKNAGAAVLPANFCPAPYYSSQPQDDAQRRKYTEARKLGAELISAGKVAAFVVGGGQGTRLGFDWPKGDFHISPVKNKTLFQIFAEMITAVSQRYSPDSAAKSAPGETSPRGGPTGQTVCPWYIMTSPLNYPQTQDIFRRNGYYGLRESDVFIFEQDTLPNFGFDGRILLADKDRIARSPDGHGGSLKAALRAGAIEDMKKRGVEFISYWQVDNPLVNIIDPLFIGLHALDKAEMSSKGLVKRGPKEKVGNFCLVDGRVTVIEYSDLPDDLAEKRNPDGSLVFRLGSIAIHIINTSFVERLNVKGFSLPLHRAVKKISHIDEHGNHIEPDKPNGIKLETFVFDALPLAGKSVVLETLRSEEFAPVKNATGPDSAEITRRMMVDRAAGWLESAGVAVPHRPDGSVDCLIEISPSFALNKEDVITKKDRIPKIKAGDEIYLA
jgi:UDP-N-acetylglucosamine/UDP-N-acetylgalactosamine diphosphorylase